LLELEIHLAKRGSGVHRCYGHTAPYWGADVMLNSNPTGRLTDFRTLPPFYIPPLEQQGFLLLALFVFFSLLSYIQSASHKP